MNISKFIRVTLFVNIVVSSIFSCNEKENHSLKESKNKLIKYSIFKEETTDTPGKTQILTDIIINKNDSISKKKIEDLLIHLYKERINQRNFQYRENPNSVAIYAYLSKKKAESGMGQWIAMISKMPIDTESKITFSQSAFNSLNEKEENKWNLSFDTRQEIWNKIIDAERDSQSEADNTHTLVKGSTMEDLEKNGILAEKLKMEKEAKIIKDYKISRNILDSIGFEGLSNDWAFPNR